MANNEDKLDNDKDDEVMDVTSSTPPQCPRVAVVGDIEAEVIGTPTPSKTNKCVLVANLES